MGYSTFVLGRLRDARRRHEPAGVAAHAHLHVCDSLSVERGRHHLKAGGEVRHYQSDGYNHLFARGQTDVPRRLHGRRPRRPAARAAIAVAARRQRQPAGAADDRVQPVRAARLAARIVAHDQHRAAVRAEPRRRSTRRIACGSSTSTTRTLVTGRRERRPAVRREHRPQQPGPARRRELEAAWPQPRLTAARRLRSLLRQRHPHRELGAVLQPAVLRPPGVRPAGRQPLTLANPFPAGRGLPAIALRQHAACPTYRHRDDRPGQPRPRTRRSHGVDLGGALRGRARPHLVRRRNINQPVPGPGAARPAPADCRLRRHPAGRARGLLVVPRACSCALERQRAQRPVAARGLHVVQVDRRRIGVPARATATTTRRSREATPPRNAACRTSTCAIGCRPRPSGCFPIDARWSWARGWQASAIVAVQSGRPFTPRVGFDNSNTGNVGGSFGYDRPNEVDPSAAPADARALRRSRLRHRAAVHVRQRRTEHPRSGRRLRASTQHSRGCSA